MKSKRALNIVLAGLTLLIPLLNVLAQQPGLSPLPHFPSQTESLVAQERPVRSRRRKAVPRRPYRAPVIPPVTILHNPEYLSGEASVDVAANSNPLIRIGIAQNGVTLIEFPAADKFFAVHSGNSDLVTVEKSPSLKRDHHLVLRAGSGFVVPSAKVRASFGPIPATSLIAQMDSGMAITLMIYPVPLLRQQAHRLVIRYDCDQVISSRRAIGLATNLVAQATESQSVVAAQSENTSEAEQTAAPPEAPAQNSGNKISKPDFKEPTEVALANAIKAAGSFKRWSTPRHGLQVCAMSPRELSDSVRVVVFAVRNTGLEPLRIISGYPDLYIETLNENRKPVEAGTRVGKVYLASSSADNLIAPGDIRYFALAYEAPILGAQQHLKIVVAHMTAADEPATADLAALAR